MIKSKSITRLLTLIVSLCLTASLMPVPALASGGRTYYVSPQGSDTSSGSSSAPWKTLSHAVGEMQSGDTLVLKDGIYREELVADGKSNLTLRAENKGGAVISACDLVTGWTLDSENIWKATVDADTDVYNGDGNIVFAGGILCQEARWPDLGEGRDGAHPLLNLDNYARVDLPEVVGTTPVITDSDLAQFSSSDLENAYVWCPGGPAYWAYVSPVTDFDTATNTLTLDKDHFTGGSAYFPKKNNIYYLFGSKSFLSAEGEWHREGDSLYMYHEGSSAPADVELRAREYTMRVNSADAITVDGISFRGGIPFIGENTTDCVVTGCTFETVDYYMPRSEKSSQNDWQPTARGVLLNGTRNKIVNSEFCNLYGEGVLLYGDDNKVLNNYFHDYNFEATYADGVQVKNGSRHLISHNTFTHSGRSAVGGYFRKTVISYNDISDGGILTRDGGVVYLSNYDFDSSEFHHNVLGTSLNNEGMQYGLYMDSLCAGLNVYRNLVYGQESDENERSLTLVTSYHNIGNLFANNTFVNLGNTDWSLNMDHSQTVFVNNIFADYCTYDERRLGSEKSSNLEYFTGFANAVNSDYTLASTATDAIDKGKHIPGITDGFSGDAPDIGAFEYGADMWDAGHDFANSSYANESYSLNTRIPYSNRVENSSFEYFTGTAKQAVFNGWTSDTPVCYLKRSAWNSMDTTGTGNSMYTKNGSYAAGIKKGQTLTQTITGLKPNTAYEIGAYATSVGSSWSSYNNDYPVYGHSAKYSDGYITGFTAGGTEDWFCYAPITFDEDTDTIRFDVTMGKSAASGVSRKIEIYTAGDKAVDLAEGKYDSGEDIAGATLLSTIDVDIAPGTSKWYDATFSQAISGDHKIYFKFIGDFYGVTLLRNSNAIYMFNKSATDRAILKATSDSGQTSELEFTEIAGIPSQMKTATVMTGNSGSVKVDLTKTEGSMTAYFDEVRLRESFTQNAYDKSSLVMDYAVFDDTGAQMHSIRKNTNHTVKGSVEDINGIGGGVKFTLSSVDKDGTVCETTEQTQVVPASGKLDFEITVKTPLSEDCYLTFSVETDSVATYTISDFTLSEQYDGSDIFTDDISIYKLADGVPVLASSFVKGEFNMFELALKNRSAEDVAFTGILALYDGLKLIEVLSMEAVIDANDSDRFWLGTVLPDIENLSVKLFTWESTNTLKPIVEHKLFE